MYLSFIGDCIKEREHNILKGVINVFDYLFICGSFKSAISSLILPDLLLAKLLQVRQLIFIKSLDLLICC